RDEQQQEDEECSKPVLAARGASLEVDVVLEEALDGLAEGCAVERQREVIGAGGTAWRSTEALPPIALAGRHSGSWRSLTGGAGVVCCIRVVGHDDLRL